VDLSTRVQFPPVTPFQRGVVTITSMFYSRPKIEPLGWDLVALPTPDGSRNFAGLTSDMRPVDFRFSGGWLTVERGAVNASPDSDLEEVLSVPISPFGVMDIYPVQLCDILGLTVNGQKIDVDGLNPLARRFDWSGRTTYWESQHLMEYRRDPERFIRELTRVFPDSVLIQPSWEDGATVRCRQIKFLMASDEMVMIGIGCDRARVERLLTDEVVSTPEFASVFAYRIEFSRRDYSWDDVTGKKYIEARGAGKLDLDYSVLVHRRYLIRTEYSTEDPKGQSVMKKLSSLMDRYFSRGFQIVNLQTGAVIREDLTDEYDTRSYSNTLRDCCLSRPKQYLTVDVDGKPDSRVANEDVVFIGMRPL
jgi:hypothetical protein